jgi:regulator of RNase E activity RraB
MVTDYPDDSDGDALRRVAASGGDMSKPMDIDFQIAVSDEATAKRVADKAAELGYRTSIYVIDDYERSGYPWTCECTTAMIPTYTSLIAAQTELDAIANPLGACVDGWGTYGGGEQYTMSDVEPEPATPTLDRRRFQYSLRSLLGFVN